MYALFIDNDEDCFNSLRNTLADVVTLEQAFDVDAGLERAKESAPSAIILCVDISKGWRACSQIRRDSKLRYIPLIVTSAKATAEQFEQHRQLKMSANAYFSKLVTTSALADAIRTIIQPRQSSKTALSATIEPISGSHVSEWSHFEGTAADSQSSVISDGDSFSLSDVAPADMSSDLIAMETQLQKIRKENELLQEELRKARKESAEAESTISSLEHQCREKSEALEKTLALYSDLCDAFQAAVEHLSAPMKILERHRELVEGSHDTDLN